MTNQADILRNIIFETKKLPLVKQNNLLNKRLSLLQEKFDQNEFQLVVLGQFKRGKTTLINALIGENLLPTAIVPLTSIITILKYSEKEKAVVSFSDGHKKEISLSQIEDYVTEVKNPKNIKKVTKVIIGYPSKFLKIGIQIIDTPGVGSVYKHNTDVSYEFVPKADAGIFVFTADPPISESELQFLNSVKDYLGKIIFVQNKIDQISESERRESLEFTKKVISEAVGTSALLFFQLSAKKGLEGKQTRNKKKLEESLLANFEDKLINFLIENKGKIFLESLTRKMLSIIEELKFALQIEKQSLSMPVATLKEKMSQFDKEISRIQQEKEDSEYILQGQMEKIVNQELIEDIEILKEKKLPLFLSDFDNFFQSRKEDSGKQLSEAFNIFLEKSIKKIFTDWRKEEEAKLHKSLILLLDRFSSQTNEFISQAVSLSADLFNIKVNKLDKDIRLFEKYDFRFSFDEYQVDLDLYKPVITRLPKFLSNKLLYKKMRDEVIQEFDKHCGRSRYDFHQRVLESINMFKNNLDEVLEETIQGIKIAMQKGLYQQHKNIKKEADLSKAIQKQEAFFNDSLSKLKGIINLKH